MKKRIVFLIALMGALASSGLAGLISIAPSSLTVNSGQNFSLNVNAINLSDLYGFQFDLSLMPSLLSAGGITEGSFLSGVAPTVFVPGVIDNAGGTISFTAASLVGAIQGANGNGTLATVQFKALAVGTSQITLSNVTLLNSALSTITATIANGAVTIQGPTTGVPEPATFLLLAGGLGLLLIGVRKKLNCSDRISNSGRGDYRSSCGCSSPQTHRKGGTTQTEA